MIPTRERELALSCALGSVTIARHFVRDTLLEWNLERLVEDAELGVSELVANAVRYAKTDVTLHVSAGREMTVSVVDRVPVLRRPLQSSQDNLLAESGRGLRIVAAVADDWGIELRNGGKAVWFTLVLPDAGAADADLVVLKRPTEANQEHGARTAVSG